MDADNIEPLVYARIDGPEPVLAGTLTLMSSFLNGGCIHLAQKVIHNLTVLSSRPEFSEEFRRLCLNLRAHWCNECARGAVPGHAGPDDAAAPPTAPRKALH